MLLTCVIHLVVFMGMKKQFTVVGRGENARIRLDEHLGP